MASIFLVLCILAAPVVAGRASYPSEHTDRAEIVVVDATAQTATIIVGDEVVVDRGSGLLAVVCTSIDAVVVDSTAPAPLHVRRSIIQTDDTRDQLASLDATRGLVFHSSPRALDPCAILFPNHTVGAHTSPVPMDALREDGAVWFLCENPRAAPPDYGILRVRPVLDGAFAVIPIYFWVPACAPDDRPAPPGAACLVVECPRTFPDLAPGDAVHDIALYALSDADRVLVDSARLDCARPYVLFPATAAYQIAYVVSDPDGTVLARQDHLIGPTDALGPAPPRAKPVAPALVPARAAIVLEQDQFMPRFPDSPGAFAVATTDEGAQPGDVWVVEMNGVFLAADGPSFRFIVHFGQSYRVRFWFTRANATTATLAAVLDPPEPGFVRETLPLAPDCAGWAVPGVATNVPYTLSAGVVTAADGHVHRLHRIPVDPTAIPACTSDDWPGQDQSPADSRVAVSITVSVSTDWPDGLTDDEACAGMAFVVFSCHTDFDRPILIEYDGVLIPVDRENRARVAVPLPVAIGAVAVYTDWGARLLGEYPVTNLAANAVSPISAKPPFSPADLLPYVSDAKRGRVRVAANLTDRTGELVDATALYPGVYLATASRSSWAHAREIVCVWRDLVTIPLASAPYASIGAITSEAVARCPRGARATPFQVAVRGADAQRSLVIWDESAGRAEPFCADPPCSARIVARPGWYQLLDTQTGEYSLPIELQASPHSVERDFRFRFTPRAATPGVNAPVQDIEFVYPAGLRVDLRVAACRPRSPRDRCGADNLRIIRDGLAVLEHLPYADSIVLDVIVAGACSFTRETHLLPLSSGLPDRIERLECAMKCDGSIVVTPMLLDPRTGKEHAVAGIPYATYRGSVDGVVRSAAPTMHIPAPHSIGTLRVAYAIEQNGRVITAEATCGLPARIAVLPRIDLPVFCPGESDARVAFGGLDYPGTVEHAGRIYDAADLRIRGLSGLGAGDHRFVYRTGACVAEESLYIPSKVRYAVEARVAPHPGLAESSIELLPGGEFDVITADMVLPESRVYIDDDGAGTTAVAGLPNGGAISIMVPYPETYAHIRVDFCPRPAVLSAGTLVPPPVASPPARPAPPDGCAATRPAHRVALGRLPQPAEMLRGAHAVAHGDDMRIDYVDATGCGFAIQWLPLADQPPPARRRDAPGVARRQRQTVFSASCRIDRQPSCPSCTDAAVHVDVLPFAHGPVMYVWSDGAVLDDSARGGLAAGTYIVTAVERGADTAHSPFCVVVLKPGVATRVVGVRVDRLIGCGADARAAASIAVVGSATGYAITPDSDPVVEHCADPRLQPSAVFSLPSPGGAPRTYRTAVCDGALVVAGPDVVHESADRPQIVATAVDDVCAHTDGGFALRIDNAFGEVEALRGNESIETAFADGILAGPAEEATTIAIVDERGCPVYVDVVPVSCSVSAFSSMLVAAPAYDCVINASTTVEDAVLEIDWCAGEELQITGSGAPVIDVPVAPPTRATLSMRFLQMTDLEFDSDMVFLLDMLLSNRTQTRSKIATFSYGTVGGTLTLPGNSNVGTAAPNQQISIQYATVTDGFTVAFPAGSSSVLLNIAYLTADTVVIVADREATVQLLTATIGDVQLHLPAATSTLLRLSSNGGGRIRMLTLFIPGGRVVVNATTNATTSSNATIQTACAYLLAYPSIVESARGGYGGPIVNDTDTCIEFGGVPSPSQSQSRSARVNEPVEFSDGLSIMFSMVAMVSIIATILIGVAWSKIV